VSPSPARRATAELARIVAGEGPAGDPVCGWPALLGAAAEHRLQPALWSAFRRRGVVSVPLEIDPARRSPLAVLEQAYVENEARVADLRAHALLVLDALEAAGIDAVPIKGAHWLLAGWLPDPAARVTVDVDVLVPAALAADARAVLRSVGYAETPVSPDRDLATHELPAVVLPSRRASVELHVAPLGGGHASILAADEVREGAADTTVGGRRRRLPAPDHAVVLLIAHAQLQDGGARLLHLPLRALLDLQALAAAPRVVVDWDAVVARFELGGREGATGLAGFLAAARRLPGIGSLPPAGAAGEAWLGAVGWALDHPAAARRYREAVSLPRALRPARMAALYGDRARSGAALAAARSRHLAAGATRRLR
jgi:hypothetical protein